jgi:hypothetical protein
MHLLWNLFHKRPKHRLPPWATSTAAATLRQSQAAALRF